MQYIKSLLFWFILIVVIAISYGFKNEILNSKYIAVFVPHKGYKDQFGNLVFQKSMDGHFYVQIKINNQNIKLLVDTGATDVVLSKQDAQKINLNLNNIKYFKRYNTANGEIKAGVVKIPQIAIGNFMLKDFEVSISNSQMSTSLLGMSFLQNFNFSIKDNSLILSSLHKNN